jgi:uncharacterized protein YbaA (DUF1428 family)
MPRYVDGFLLPLPKRNLARYRKMAKTASKVWREHGALEYVECIGDELGCPGMTPFPKAAGAKKGEVVVMAWIVHKSKAHRDRTNKAVMQDPRLGSLMDLKNMPFDCSRMAYAGFKVLVEG